MFQLGRKALALLVYLSLSSGFRVSREKLSDMLWPDRPTAQGRNNLRQIVSVLRRAMPDSFDQLIRTERDFIMLVPGRFTCDALELLEACKSPGAAEASRAAELYRGPFLDGFYSGSDVFDDWASAVRSKLQSAAVHSLYGGIRSSTTDKGISLLGQLLTIDPTHEASYQLGMELHSAKWQHDQALRFYEACKAMLAREFGVAPSPETERIRKRILESDPVPRDTAPASMQQVPASLRSQPKTVIIDSFQNLNGSPDDTAFMKALTETVAIELAQVHEVVVNYETAGAPRPAGCIVLSGSLLASEDGLLVMVRLADGGTGRQLGGERFSFKAQERFRYVAEIAQCVALATRFESLHAGWQLRDLLPPDRHPVRLMVLKSHCSYYELTDTSIRDAITLAEQALAIDTASLRARRMLSLALSAAMIQGVQPRCPENISRALSLARDVSRAAPDDVFSRCVLAWALGLDGQHEAAVKELRYGIHLNPTYATVHSDLAEHYAMLGYVSEALSEIDEAIRLTNDDVVSFWRYYTVTVAQFAAGNYGAAVENARRVLREKPGLIRGALFLAASAAALGFKNEATEAIRFVLAERPEIRLGNVAPGFMPRYVQDRHHEQFLANLRAAGLPE